MSNASQTRILQLYQWLRDETDATHTLSTGQILDRWSDLGISTDRRSVYKDIDTLREFGCDIVMSRGAQNSYYMVNQPFDLAEIKLLIDAVESCQIIPATATRRLVQKLTQLATIHDRENLKRPLITDKRSKLNNRLRYGAFLLIAVMILCLFAGCSSETTPVTTSVQSTPVVSEEPISVSEALPEETPVKTVERTGFSMTMLDVSQGLSLLIEADGRYMLYDGGGQSRSSYVVSYLKRQGVSELDYMVASHYDEDHISGLIGVMNTTKVDKLLSPDYTRDTHIYDSFRAKVADKGIPEEHPLRGADYKLGTADISVLGPNQYDPGADNDNSIVLKITYGDFKCVLSGDAESEEEYSVLRNNTDIRADLYVVGHHGSADSSSKEFVQAIAPKYAFLSVGKDNAYGHPNPVTLNTLMENNVQLFRTDQQGEVTVTSDGQSVSINKPPVDTTIGDPSAAADRQQVEENPTGDSHKYVLNTNPSRKRIHRPDCRSVQDIKQENFQYSDKTLEELIAEGYTPCGNCHPQ